MASLIALVFMLNLGWQCGLEGPCVCKMTLFHDCSPANFHTWVPNSSFSQVGESSGFRPWAVIAYTGSVTLGHLWNHFVPQFPFTEGLSVILQFLGWCTCKWVEFCGTLCSILCRESEWMLPIIFTQFCIRVHWSTWGPTPSSLVSSPTST